MNLLSKTRDYKYLKEGLNMTAKEIVEKEDIIIKNGAFYKKVCLNNCPKITSCKYCEHKLSKQDFDAVYNAIQKNEI